jgi:hypothetical protein
MKYITPYSAKVIVNIKQQHLVKHNELHDDMQFVINAVNKIKAKSLNGRLFQQLCHENYEAFKRLLLHTEVRWLTKRNCLTYFYNVFKTII